MKKLRIVYQDNSSVTYRIPDKIDENEYFDKNNPVIKGVTLQKYPLKANKLIYLKI